MCRDIWIGYSNKWNGGMGTNKIIIKMINLRIGEVLMMDIILGFTMETYAIKHLELLKKYVSTISLIYLVYLGFFLIGSFMYWDAVFSIKGRVKKYFLKKNDGDYDRIWVVYQMQNIVKAYYVDLYWNLSGKM